jgi:hypothetical protein
MLRFFRRIRQKLLNEGSLKKYLIYAIGEIALVVIGILIALQINNWNEARKLRDKELEYLQGIKSDLEQDLEFIKQSKVLYTRQIMGYSKLGVKFERYVYKDWDYPLVKIRDTTQNLSISNLFGRPFAVRLRPGTYRSLTSSGESKIIRNQDLFNQFQNVYERRALTLESTYGTVKEFEIELFRKHSKEIYNFPFERAEAINDEDLLADLYGFMRSIGRVYNAISLLEQEILEAVKGIEQELE